MADGEWRFYNRGPVYYSNNDHKHRNEMNPYALYGHSLPFPDPQRVSLSSPTPHAGGSEALDLSRYDDAVPGSQIDRIPVQSLVKSAHDHGWVPQSQSRLSEQSRAHPLALGWYGGGPSKPGAMSDPTPHQETFGEMSSENSMSEAEDSGPSSQVSTAMKEPASLDQFSLDDPIAEPDYFHTHLTPGTNIPEAPAQRCPPPQSVVSDSRLHLQPRDARKGRLGKTPLTPCQVCKRTPKNMSDAKKHSLTHIKPFKCAEPACNRQDGFATENDLQRHRKSVHKLVPTVGSAEGFICAACPVPEGGKRPKLWPRRDNFKAHVKRKHSNWNVAELIKSSTQTTRPEDASTAPSVGQSSYPESTANSNDHRRSVVSNMQHISYTSRRTSQLDETSNPWSSGSVSEYPRGEASLLGSMGHATVSEHPMMASTELHHLVEPPDTNPLQILSETQFSQAFTSFMRPSSPQELQAVKRPRLTEASDHGGSEQHLHIDDLGAGSNMRAGSSGQASAVDGTVNQGPFPCPCCDKTTQRECDYKKHMKRHTRPYGCTFPRCSKRFGSRNDWKRHESSQHYLSEIWKCRWKCSDGSVCANPPFPRSDQLKKHLVNQHGLNEAKEIDAACAKYRLGRNATDHFWCGFCQKLIEQEKDNPYAYAARFQHIGDHFDKDQRRIETWVCIERNTPKGQIMAQEYEVGRKQKSAKLDSDKNEAEGAVCADSTRSMIKRPNNTPAEFPKPTKFQQIEVPRILKREERKSAAERLQIKEDTEVFSDPAW